MPLRSINIKMRLKRAAEGRALRQSLWLTHSVVNCAVAEIERVLLLCRGRGYWTGDDEPVSAETVQQQALAFARETQARNGQPGIGGDAEILAALRGLYEAIVPSVNRDEQGRPLEGNAQAAGGFAGPMMDAESEGFQSVFDKILEPLPSWVAKMTGGTRGWEQESVQWLKSPESERLQHASGSPPAWVRRLRTGEPWQEAFVQDQENKRKEVKGVPSLIQRLKKELGLLPLMRPPITLQFEDKRSGLTPWDRLTLRLAVAHLLSWESWNHRAADEHGRVTERLARLETEAAPLASLIEGLREYEKIRHEELKRVAQANDENPFRIGARGVRGWDRVREAWLGATDDTKEGRFTSVAALQTKLGGRFGDPDLFRWLAEEGREHLWGEHDPLPILARLNALSRLLRRKKDHAIYTAPDARLHPRWTAYEAPGGGNLRNYSFEISGNDLALRLPLLRRVESGLEEDSQRAEIALAPSGQFQSASWKGDGKPNRHLTYYSAHEQFSAELGGAEILYRRRHLENRKVKELEQGDIGPVWLKLVLDVQPNAPEGWFTPRGRVVTPPTVHHFNTALVNRSKHAPDLVPGLRVLAVDLGVRTFAACSVFELVQGEPGNGMAFLADQERDLWARHERSFLLPLPGEAVDSQLLAARRAAYNQLGLLRRDLGRLKGILRLSVKETAENRCGSLEELLASLEDEWNRGNAPAIDVAALLSAKGCLEMPQPAWEAAIAGTYQAAERELGNRVRDWRRTTRPRTTGEDDRRQRRGYSGGKSAWAVEYLDQVRRLLQGWSLHGRSYAQIRRLDREKMGTFAAGLLDHINALKQDRVKTGSDLIVQAARGYLPTGKKGWIKQYEPCRLILFEDLARYRFRTDRPRRENARLMRWNHRQILTETELQAEIFGLLIGTTGAGFSSRFHARSGAPGCRTRLLTAEDLRSPTLAKQLELLAETQGIDPKCFRPGMQIPWDSGADFVTLDSEGKLVQIHADVNAAQNLQRRFWTRFRDAYRISAVEIKQDGRTSWYPDREGVRLRGALSTIVGGDGYARLVAADDDDGFVLEKVTRPHWRRAAGAQAESGDDVGLDEVALEMAEAMDTDLERGEGRLVFFRDPSGSVIRADRWYQAKAFWGQVRSRVTRALGLRRPGASS